MRFTTRSTLCSLGLALVTGAAQAAGTVQVSYVQPDKFADAGNARSDIDDNLKQLTSHFEALAKRYLDDGQKLSIEVLDVDMAGEMRPLIRRAGQDLRVLKGRADWPRIKLRYTLESAGQVLRKGEQQVSDMAYLQRIGGYYGSSEPLRYEKRMLDDWFAAQFGAAGAK